MLFCFVWTFHCLLLVFEIVAVFVPSRWLDISLVVFMLLSIRTKFENIWPFYACGVGGKAKCCWVI